MKKTVIGLLIAFCVLVFCVVDTAFGAIQTVKGTLLYIANDASIIGVSLEDRSLLIKPSPKAKILRGQVGKDMRSVELREFALGDTVIAVVDDNGSASSLKALFGIVKGTFSKLQSNALMLKDGRSVRLHSDARVLLADGHAGTASDLKKGDLLLCRLNPLDNQAWMVLVVTLADPVTTPVKPVVIPQPVIKTPVPAVVNIEKPIIKSIKYSCSAPVKAGDKITVDVTGTPGGKAAFEIKHLIALTPMKETSLGSYQAVVTVPKGKTVQNAAIVGYLNINNVKASPVQASALISVGVQPKFAAVNIQPVVITVPTQIEPKATITKVAGSVSTTATAPQVVITPENKPEPQKIILTMPFDGAQIKRALQIKGIAEPESKVMTEITYTNGLMGLLKLSGRVASQLIAVGKNGEFKLGPILLEGPLATQGLEFTIKTYYPDKDDHGTVVVKVIGARG